jgi:citrate synthase
MMRQCIRLIAVFPSLVASGYAARQGYYDPAENLEDDFSAHTIAENFLYRLRPDHNFSAEEVRLLDLCMVLHAEHGGGNNSAFTCRVLSSSGADTYSAIAGAVCSLKGPLHGGANLQVNQMLEDIKVGVSHHDDEDELAGYLEKILRGEAGDGSGKIYGMGHAIYTLSDPRAVLLKKYAKEMCETRDSEFRKDFELLERIERLTPGVFRNYKGGAEKVICANVDFYSGLVYRMLGIPEELFTPLFAIARVSGWAAHRIEEVVTGARIIRPAYKAITLENPYIALRDRG